MPYFVLPSDAVVPDPPDWVIVRSLTTTEFPDRQTAYELAVQYKGRIIFAPSPDELSEWRQRERNRFREGTYIHVPWSERVIDDCFYHFAHLSLDTPGMIAYTADPEKGIQDRQTRTKPGRYLQQFYADVFSAEEIAQYIAECAAVHSSVSLATSLSDVRKVYRNGPQSCMGGPASHTDQYWTEDDLDGHRPIDVYADSDLAVAYFGPLSAPSQRAIVWPDRHVYSRIYGTGPLETMLKRDGYRPGSLSGASVRAIRFRDGYIIPYVDNVNYGSVKNGAIIFGDNSGRYSQNVPMSNVSGHSATDCY